MFEGLLNGFYGQGLYAVAGLANSGFAVYE
jgi:hypothetical protein